MKRIILCLCLFIFIRTEAQQINPVPDYVFSNKMSVGRNAVTDTAAYFSIGPRYGAIRGMMPPMVTDTASMSATKRNGLLIFSIQKNKYLYWDSVGSKWAEMAGTAGSAITGSGVAGYMPEFTTSTNLDTTRLYHSAGRFAIGSTTTTNGVFNVYGGQAYFDTSLKVGTQTLLADESKNEVYVNTTSDAGAFALQVSGNQYISGTQSIGTTTAPIGSKRTRYAYEGGIEFERSDGGQTGLITTFNSYDLLINNNNASITMERISGKIFFNPSNTYEVYVNTSTDAGAYALQVAGSIYNTTGAVLAASSGNVGIGTASPGSKLDVQGAISSTTNFRFNNNDFSQAAILETGSGWIAGGYNFKLSGTTPVHAATGSASGYFWRDGNIAFWTNSSASANTNIPERMRIKDDGEILIGTTSDAGTYALQVAGSIYNTTTITTGAPSGGTAKPFKIGAAATVSPTSPNRTIEIEIDGTTYYIHAKTTND